MCDADMAIHYDYLPRTEDPVKANLHSIAQHFY
jgi:hypothetical protein